MIALVWVLLLASFATGEDNFGSSFLDELQAPDALVYQAVLQDVNDWESISHSSLRVSLQSQKTSLSVSNNNDDRKLEDGSASAFSNSFSIPFRLVWNMAFEPGTDLREPTEDEYNGLFYATLRWLLASANEVYADMTDTFTINGFDMTHYGASFNATDPYPSTVGMECKCLFDANNELDIPSTIQFLVTLSAEYNRTIFVREYLNPDESQPDTGIFRNVQEDIRYNILPSALPVVSTNADSIELATISLDMRFHLGIGFGISDREPDDPEYEGYLEATTEWIKDLFVQAYPGTDPSLPAFHVLSSSLESQIYNDNAALPHRIHVLTDISFRLPPNYNGAVVTTQDAWSLLKSDGVLNYRDNYLSQAEPSSNLFRATLTVTWSPGVPGVYAFQVP